MTTPTKKTRTPSVKITELTNDIDRLKRLSRKAGFNENYLTRTAGINWRELNLVYNPLITNVTSVKFANATKAYESKIRKAGNSIILTDRGYMVVPGLDNPAIINTTSVRRKETSEKPKRISSPLVNELNKLAKKTLINIENVPENLYWKDMPAVYDAPNNKFYLNSIKFRADNKKNNRTIQPTTIGDLLFDEYTIYNYNTPIVRETQVIDEDNDNRRRRRPENEQRLWTVKMTGNKNAKNFINKNDQNAPNVIDYDYINNPNIGRDKDVLRNSSVFKNIINDAKKNYGHVDFKTFVNKTIEAWKSLSVNYPDINRRKGANNISITPYVIIKFYRYTPEKIVYGDNSAVDYYYKYNISDPEYNSVEIKEFMKGPDAVIERIMENSPKYIDADVGDFFNEKWGSVEMYDSSTNPKNDIFIIDTSYVDIQSYKILGSEAEDNTCHDFLIFKTLTLDEIKDDFEHSIMKLLFKDEVKTKKITKKCFSKLKCIPSALFLIRRKAIENNDSEIKQYLEVMLEDNCVAFQNGCVETLVECFEKYEIPIAIYFNSFYNFDNKYPEKKLHSWNTSNGFKYVEVVTNHTHEANVLKTKNLNINPKYSLIYDSHHRHIEMSETVFPIFHDNVYVYNNIHIIKNDFICNGPTKNHKFTEKEIDKINDNKKKYKNSKSKVALKNNIDKKINDLFSKNIIFNGPYTDVDDVEKILCFFDFETVMDHSVNQRAVAYAVSFLFITPQACDYLSQLETCIKNGDAQALQDANEISNKIVKNFVGFKCVDRFIDYIAYVGAITQKDIKFVGFNNAAFDNIILLRELYQTNLCSVTVEDDYLKLPEGYLNITEPQYHANRLDSWHFMGGKASFLDLRRHINDNLNNVCASFKVNYFGKKKDLIDFSVVQNLYNDNRKDFIELLDKKIEGGVEQLKKYNNFDCLSLAVIYSRYINTINTLPSIADIRRYAKDIENENAEKNKHNVKNAEEEKENRKKYQIFKSVDDYPTISAMMYKASKLYNKKNKIYLPPTDLDFYNTIRQSSIGGRCDTFESPDLDYENSVCPKKITERCFSLDVTSMYPYCMFVSSDSFFGCGAYKKFTMTDDIEFEILNEPKLLLTKYNGFFKLKMVSQHQFKYTNKANVIPDKYTKPGINNWDSDKVLRDIWLCSVDVLSLIEEGAYIEFYKEKFYDEGKKLAYHQTLIEKRIKDFEKYNENNDNSEEDIIKYETKYNSELEQKVKEFDNEIATSYIFSKVVRGYELFGWLSHFMRLKNEQDELKRIGSPDYNPVLRELCKLALNSLSGKYNQRAFSSKIINCDIKEVNSYFDGSKTHIIKESVSVVSVYGNKVILSYKEKDECSVKEAKSNCWIGCFIYAYARRHLMRTVITHLSKQELLYCDTDAVKMTQSTFDKITSEYLSVTQVPHWPEIEDIDPRYKNHCLFQEKSKVFGSFENELSENNYTVIIGKKMWCSALIKNNEIVKNKKDEYMIKYKLKGISPKSLYISDVESLQDELGIEIKRNENTLDIINITIKKPEKCDKFVLNHPELTFSNPLVAKTVYEDLVIGKSVFFLTNTFTKVIKSSKFGTKLDDINNHCAGHNSINISYAIKKINTFENL